MRSEFESLHLARIRGLVPADVMGDVGALVEASLILVSDHGCMLTPAGLERHAELLQEWRSTVDLDVVALSYDRFLAVNKPVKEICSRWQSLPQTDEDLFVVADELSGIVERVRPAMLRAGDVAPRFGAYVRRLETAVNCAVEGDRRFVTSPGVDSVHNIWFECHEDYLTTLGRDREEEGSY